MSPYVGNRHEGAYLTARETCSTYLQFNMLYYSFTGVKLSPSVSEYSHPSPLDSCRSMTSSMLGKHYNPNCSFHL